MVRYSCLHNLDHVPEHLRRVDALLIEWAKWSKDPKAKAARCGSLEANYNPRQPEVLAVTKRLSIGTDRKSAEGIQSIVSTLNDESQRLLLHYWYIHRTSPGFISRKLRIYGNDNLYIAINNARSAVDLVMRRRNIGFTQDSEQGSLKHQ